jgi:hypothetical protein
MFLVIALASPSFSFTMVLPEAGDCVLSSLVAHGFSNAKVDFWS